MQTAMLIGGRFVGGEAAADVVLDAASGAQIASVPSASVAQVQAAIAAAEDAFRAWARTPPKERAALLLEQNKDWDSKRQQKEVASRAVP